MKLKYQWPFVWLLVLLLPFRDSFALTVNDGTLMRHMLWPLVHANALHWLINTLCFMALWRTVTPFRLVTGYAASVAIGYIWPWCVSVAILYGLPGNEDIRLCGFSGVCFYLLGTVFMRMPRPYRVRLSVLIVISCFIPGIAASVHILTLSCGILYSYLKRFIRPSGHTSHFVYD